MTGDNYVKIDCKILRVTTKAVRIDVDGSEVWIPRSCVHGADERGLDQFNQGDEAMLRIFEWIAKVEGLV